MKKLPKLVVPIALLVLTGLVAFVGWVYDISPTAILTPRLEHLHFRMQVLVDGKAENFSDSKYQEQSPKDVCSDGIPEEPIHFHDSKDQFVHVHWKNMTGGMVLKYYGWNYIGGLNSILGYRLDELPKFQAVPIHGTILPHVPHNDRFYVYSGDEKSFHERTFEDWENQTLEQFFGKSSNFPNASAKKNEGEEDKLTRLNNLIGNVVIFVQKDRPTDVQIKQRFNHLAPLGKSACAG